MIENSGMGGVKEVFLPRTYAYVPDPSGLAVYLLLGLM